MDMVEETAIRLQNSLHVLDENSEMTNSLINEVLELKNRPNRQFAYKFILLRWFVANGCRFVSSPDGMSNGVPPGWMDQTRFDMIYGRYSFFFVIQMEEEGVSVTIIHCLKNKKRSLSRMIFATLETIPDLSDSAITHDISEAKHEAIRGYNELIYALDSRFYEIFHLDPESRYHAEYYEYDDFDDDQCV